MSFTDFAVYLKFFYLVYVRDASDQFPLTFKSFRWCDWILWFQCTETSWSLSYRLLFYSIKLVFVCLHARGDAFSCTGLLIHNMIETFFLLRWYIFLLTSPTVQIWFTGKAKSVQPLKRELYWWAHLFYGIFIEYLCQRLFVFCIQNCKLG